MIQRFLRQSGCRLASFFAIILCLISVVLGGYAYSAAQKASADYTTLVRDILLAQQASPQLRAAVEEARSQPGMEPNTYIDYFIALSQRHLINIQSRIRQHPHITSEVEHLNHSFNELNNRLLDLNQQARQTWLRIGSVDELQRAALEMGAFQTNLYNRLLEEIHTLSDQQSQAMQRLSTTISVLLVLVISTTATLCLAVMHLHRQRNVMQQLMLTDELTGLYNRRHLVSVAFAAIAQSERDKTPLSLLLLDLDHFKQINDLYGHPTGDEVLRQISKKLRQLSRPSDTLARIGGEEFCLLMPNTGTYDALQVADRLRLEIEGNQLTGLVLHAHPTISIGVTTGDGSSLTFEQLYAFADQALYLAKSMGRNRVESVLPPLSTGLGSAEGAYAHSAIS